MSDGPAEGMAKALQDNFVIKAREAIRHFIVQYAMTERALMALLEDLLQRRLFKSRYSNEGVQVIAALIGNIRMEKLRTKIKEVAVRLGSLPEDVTIIDQTASQISSIAQFRNRIAHYGANYNTHSDPQTIQTSNKYNVADYEKREI